MLRGDLIVGDLWNLLELKQEGVSILVSTPYMDEAELCDRIALIQDGESMKRDTPEGIKSAYDQSLWAVSSNSMSKLLKDLRSNHAILSTYAFGDAHHLTMEPGFTQDQLFEYLCSAFLE